MPSSEASTKGAGMASEPDDDVDFDDLVEPAYCACGNELETEDELLGGICDDCYAEQDD